MDQQTQGKLEAKGWKVGTFSDFLELSPEEAILVEMKLALSRSLKERRQQCICQCCFIFL
ncbi:MAG: hypothetical protein QNJ51_17895 [Calothrix sp. MO_167.B12]|nr:hypothetical protein [Calothrix sp. MO_167.B12]